MKKILVTGTAGFIGYHLTKRLLKEGFEVVAIDCVNDFYDPRVKYARLHDLGIDLATNKTQVDGLSFHKIFLQDKAAVHEIFENNEFECVVNLAAQAGVRYQFENPFSYVDSNLSGFVTLLEEIRNHPVKHLIYASSSSVYGMNTTPVFKETDPVDHPASLYAASKRANELIAHSYSNLFAIPTTGLRFFTVYGPWGRPDMFMYKLAESIVKGTELQMFQRDGKSLWRDYTFVSDIVEGIVRLIPHAPQQKDITLPNTSSVPFSVYNIGRGEPVENAEVVAIMEEYFGKKANLKFVDAPPTEVFKTYASTELLEKEIGYRPVVSAREGVIRLVEWYKEFSKTLTS